MGEAVQALCFLAGANSIFYGDKLLVTGNPDVDADVQLLRKLGLNGHRTSAAAQQHVEGGACQSASEAGAAPGAAPAGITPMRIGHRAVTSGS